MPKQEASRTGKVKEGIFMSRLTVATALTLPALRGARVLAGKTGLDRVIECATVMETPYVTRWLRGDELVITSLYALRDDEPGQVEMVLRLAEAGIAALLIKSKVYVDRLPDAMLQEADNRGLPILELPVVIPYIDVVHAVMGEVFRRTSVRRYESDLVDDLLAGVLSEGAALATRAAAVHWNPHGGAVVAVLQIHDPAGDGFHARGLYRLCDTVVDEARAAARKVNGLAVGSGSRVRIVLTSGVEGKEIRPDEARAWFEEIHQDLRRRLGDIPLSMGIGDPVPSFRELPDSYRVACDCLALGQRLRGVGTISDSSDLGIYTFLNSFATTAGVPHAVPINRGLRKLLDGAAQGNGQLLRTLRYYLDEQGNLRRTAERLFVHYKTVQYRMRRIEAITGWDLSRPELRLEIAVQLRWLEMSAAGSGLFNESTLTNA